MGRQLNWGLVGGGEGSQIGNAHRISSAMDRQFRLVAGALDINPARGRDFAARCGIEHARSYGGWQEMLEAEKSLSSDGQRLDLVTVATPNSTHFEISKAFLDAGFDVLCEKPLTTSLDEGEELTRLAQKRGRVLAVNYGYSGYPMVRQARAMVAAGELGRVRVVVADFASCVDGRELEDDALLSLRFTGGEVGRLWTSAVAVGQMHGLTLRVFGERGGFRWAQEQPNQLYWTPLGEPTRTLERGGDGLSPATTRGSRIVVGHAEGMLEAFANIYADLAEVLTARRDGREPDSPAMSYPSGADGLHSVAVVRAAAESAADRGRWVEL